jgi:quinol monooxygenase YgiN
MARFTRKGGSVQLTTLRIFPSQEQRLHVLNVLRSVQGPTSIKPGCRCCQVYEEDGHRKAVLYMESWDSDDEFERHIRSDMYRRVLEAMELSRMPPELKFHRITESRGIELVGALRSGVEAIHHL